MKLSRSLRTLPILLLPWLTPAGASGEPLQVCATVPDLGSLVREIGGEEVAVTVFSKGPEDPHFVEAKPSFVKALSRADLFLEVGLELELGWVPVLTRSARNRRIARGAEGFLDASTGIPRLEVPSGPEDRSRGDVHRFGNPHYLLDPLNGKRVAERIRDKLSSLRPERKNYFDGRYTAFVSKLAAAMFGRDLIGKYKAADHEKLLELLGRKDGTKRLLDYLEDQRQRSLLGGWLAKTLPHRGIKAVSDHNMWPYFSQRFGIKVVGFLEPKPGISPTTRHLATLIKTMRADKVKVVLSSSYYDPRHARFVTRNAGARVVTMAHQVGARTGTESYIAMIDYNVRSLTNALK